MTTSSRRDEPERDIAQLIRKACGDPKGFLFGAVSKRVADLLREVGDRDQVEMVCLEIAEHDGLSFSAWKSLGWGTYEYFRDRMAVPDGLWRFVLWARREGDARTRLSVEFWLGKAQDAEDEEDERAAREMLDRLWAAKVMQETTWN